MNLSSMWSLSGSDLPKDTFWPPPPPFFASFNLGICLRLLSMIFWGTSCKIIYSVSFRSNPTRRTVSRSRWRKKRADNHIGLGFPRTDLPIRCTRWNSIFPFGPSKPRIPWRNSHKTSIEPTAFFPYEALASLSGMPKDFIFPLLMYLCKYSICFSLSSTVPLRNFSTNQASYSQNIWRRWQTSVWKF